MDNHDTSQVAAGEVQIYATYLKGQAVSNARRKVSKDADVDMVELTRAWLRALAIRDVSKRLYKKYAEYWIEQWATGDEITEAVLKLYAQKGLKQVKGKTVRNELSALNTFLHWCYASGVLGEVPHMPRVDLAAGTSDPNGRHRQAAPELSDADVWANIDNLPERSDRYGFPVKTRAIVEATTSLRPETLSKLSVPEHYTKGSDSLRISDDIDKEGSAREIPLPQVARDALDSVCPESGVIFGGHRLDLQARAAARKAAKQKEAAQEQRRGVLLPTLPQRRNYQPARAQWQPARRPVQSWPQALCHDVQVHSAVETGCKRSF